MKTLILAFSLLAAPALTHACEHHAADPVRLEIQIENLKSEEGQLLAVLFASEDGFPDEPAKAKQSMIIDLKREGSRFQFADLAPGKYAIAIIHDENRNGKLDTGLFGIPKEGIGFSNNPKLGVGAPSFDRVAIDVSKSGTATIRLKHY